MRQVKTDEWSGILVYIQCYEGIIHPVSLELIGEAFRLAKESGEKVYGVAAGAHMEQVKEQMTGYPMEKVFLYETEDEYLPEFYEALVVRCIEALKPSIVLVGGTYEGRALAPRLAVSFETGLTADCTSLGIDEDGNLIQTRPAFGGNVMASIVTRQSRPQFATVRPKVMEQMEKRQGLYPETVVESVTEAAGNVRVTKVKPEAMDVNETDITKQKILVVAGRGVRKKEDLSMLRELAALLGGSLASSRALVEKGWMTPGEQIGLSGNTVSPEYMITCGVSGTVQFMAGMKHTKNIIAINTDADARIFEIAHYPICGDLYEIIPELIARIKRKRGDGLSETEL